MTYMRAVLWRSLYRTTEYVRCHVLMNHHLQVSTSCDAENVGGQHKMEESGPAVTTVSHVLRGGMSLSILLGFYRERVNTQLDLCGYDAHRYELI